MSENSESALINKRNVILLRVINSNMNDAFRHSQTIVSLLKNNRETDNGHSIDHLQQKIQHLLENVTFYTHIMNMNIEHVNVTAEERRNADAYVKTQKSHEKRVKCGLCRKAFHAKESLQHMSLNRVKCAEDECKFMARDAYDRIKHVNAIHRQKVEKSVPKSSYKCYTINCGAVFYTQIELREHKLSHVNGTAKSMQPKGQVNAHNKSDTNDIAKEESHKKAKMSHEKSTEKTEESYDWGYFHKIHDNFKELAKKTKCTKMEANQETDAGVKYEGNKMPKKRFPCESEGCEKSYATKQYLNVHMKKHHTAVTNHLNISVNGSETPINCKKQTEDSDISDLLNALYSHHAQDIRY